MPPFRVRPAALASSFVVVFGMVFLPATAIAGVATCGGQPATVVGTPGPDTLVGTAGPDVLLGLGDHDTINGLGGNDIICGGRGVDTIDAGDGDDQVWGGGDGFYHGREGDWIMGGAGNDLLHGGNDPAELGGIDKREDIVVYAEAPRGIRISLGEPTVTGDGIDTIDGFFSVVGSEHADVITAGEETDVVRGLGGRDRILVDSAEGEVFGGEGDDVLRHGYAVYGGGGDDKIRGALQYANGAEGRDVMVGTPRADNYRGGRGRDDLRGRKGRDFLDGTYGKDVLSGGPGNDWLRGGPQSDAVRAGRGDDLVEPDASGGSDRNRADDLLSGGVGVDTVSYARSFVGRGVRLDLARDVARGVGTDTLLHIENATGTAFDDILRGDHGPNALDGGEGDDLLAGRRGRDKLMPDNAEDDFAERGSDLVRGGKSRDLLSYAFAAGHGGVDVDLRAETSRGRGRDKLTSIEDLEGTIAADSLVGDRMDNRLNGGGGADVLRGRGGFDRADGGTGSDSCSAEKVRNCEGSR